MPLQYNSSDVEGEGEGEGQEGGQPVSGAGADRPAKAGDPGAVLHDQAAAGQAEPDDGGELRGDDGAGQGAAGVRGAHRQAAHHHRVPREQHPGEPGEDLRPGGGEDDPREPGAGPGEISETEIHKGKELEEFRRTAQGEMGRLEVQLKEYNYYMGERDDMSRQNKDLRVSVEAEREERVREVADKEREKVQAVDKIRDEMLTTIKNMRTNLLSLKADQLDATTRLAVLQNHQLTSELQFQSKQSEKLIFENEQLLKKAANLQKDLEIHREIEDELAKRSHYSRGIIKKLTAKIAELEEALREAQGARGEPGGKAQGQDPSEELRREEVIRTLDRSLESTEKKFLKLQSESQAHRGELDALRSKLQTNENRMNGLLEVLLRAYQELEEGRLEGREGGYQIDLAQLRRKELPEWTTPELRLVVFALVGQVARLLNRRNLGLARPVRGEEESVLDTDEAVNNVRLPKLGEHSTNSRLELSLKLKELPVSVGSKLVGSQVREWGRTVHSSSQANLIRKYRLNDK